MVLRIDISLAEGDACYPKSLTSIDDYSYLTVWLIQKYTIVIPWVISLAA